MDLALNNLQRLICHKTQQTNQSPQEQWSIEIDKTNHFSINKDYFLILFNRYLYFKYCVDSSFPYLKKKEKLQEKSQIIGTKLLPGLMNKK